MATFAPAHRTDRDASAAASSTFRKAAFPSKLDLTERYIILLPSFRKVRRAWMRHRIGLITLVFATALAGFEGARAQMAPDALIGRWRSPACEASSPEAPTSLERMFEFGHSTWRVEVTFYAGGRCATPLFGIGVEGTYVLGPPSPAVAGAVEGTFHYTRKTAWALSDDGASRLAGAKCGSDSWRPGLVQDISRTGCLAFGPIGESCQGEFDVVSLTERGLQFGARRPEMCRPGGRPTALSPNPVVRATDR